MPSTKVKTRWGFGLGAAAACSADSGASSVMKRVKVRFMVSLFFSPRFACGEAYTLSPLAPLRLWRGIYLKSPRPAMRGEGQGEGAFLHDDIARDDSSESFRSLVMAIVRKVADVEDPSP